MNRYYLKVGCGQQELPTSLTSLEDALCYVEELYANSGDRVVIERDFSEWTDTQHPVKTDYT